MSGENCPDEQLSERGGGCPAERRIVRRARVRVCVCVDCPDFGGPRSLMNFVSGHQGEAIWTAPTRHPHSQAASRSNTEVIIGHRAADLQSCPSWHTILTSRNFWASSAALSSSDHSHSSDSRPPTHSDTIRRRK